MVKKLNAFTPSSRALVKLQAFQRNRSNLRDSPKRLGRWQVIWLGHKGQAFRRNAQPIKHGLSVIFFHKEKWTSTSTLTRVLYERPFWKPPLVLCKHVLKKMWSIMARGHETRHVHLGIHKKVRYASFRACQCVSFTCQSFPPLANVSVNGCPLGTPSDVCRGKGAYWAPHSKGVGPNTTARNVSFPCRFHPNLDLL